MPDPFPQSILCPTLIGRDAQVAILTRLLDQARVDHGQIALISGEAGIGKSRLVAETWKFAVDRDFIIRQGNCFEPDRTLPYAPLIDLLQTLSTEATLPTELVALLAGQGVANEDPEQAKRRLFSALTRFLTASDSPLAIGHAQLFIIEDLHWCDDTSLEFLLTFARTLATCPICLLLTYRSDEMHAALTHFLAELERRRLTTQIALPRFTQRETTDAIRAIFAQPKVRAEFAEALQALTDGNPFFVEETLKALVTAGAIYQERGAWTRKPLHELDIPRTVQDAVQRRTAQLSAGASELLAIAAVAGQRVDFDLLQAVTQQSEPTGLMQIKELIAAQLLQESEVDHFVFRHALTRQAIYQGLLGRERRRVHNALLTALETRAASDPLVASTAEFTATLAYHAYAAQQWEASWRYSRRAGEQAQALFAPRAAAEHYTNAIAAVNHLSALPPAEQVALRYRRAQLYETLGEFDLARTDYEAAVALAQGNGDRRAEWENLLSLGFLWTARSMEEAGAYLDRALAAARLMTDPALLGVTLNRIGNWQLNMGQATVALRHHQEALALFTRLQDPVGLALTHDLLGIAWMVSGDFLNSVAAHAQAIAHYRSQENWQSLASVLATAALRGGCYHGDVSCAAPATVDACWQLGAEAIHLAKRICWGFGEANAQIFLGLAMGVRGAYRRAFTCARDGMDVALDCEATIWQGLAHALFGQLYHDCFALPTAHMHLTEALTIARGIGSQEFVNIVGSFLASLFVTQGLLTQAQALLAELLPTPALRDPATSQTNSLRRLLSVQGELLLAKDDAHGALALIDGLIAVTPHARDGVVIPRLCYLRGSALVKLHEWTAAEQTLLAGIAGAEAQHLLPLLWRQQVELGRLCHRQRRREAAESHFAAALFTVEQLATELPDPTCGAMLVHGYRAALPNTPRPTPLRAAKAAFDGLTAREREVAALVAQGLANRVIAEQLVVSERTVEKHVENACSKLGFTSRTQLAVWTSEKGLT